MGDAALRGSRGRGERRRIGWYSKEVPIAALRKQTANDIQFLPYLGRKQCTHALEEKKALLRTKVNTKACMSRRIVVLRRRRCQELFARFSAFLHLHDRLPFVRCSDRPHDHAQLRPALHYNIEKRFIWTEQTHKHISHKLFCTGRKSRDIRPEYRWRRPR